MYQELVKKGALARSIGLDQLANPLFDECALPAITGEDFATWGAKALAWDRGWQMGQHNGDRAN